MNPLKWFRWKVVIVLGVLFGALYFFGLDPLAERHINDLGAGGQAGARFRIEEVALGLIQGRSLFSQFTLATPRKVPAAEEPREKVASAEEIVADLGMGDLLRKRFAVDEVSVRKPLLRIERRADGTINVGEIGSDEPEKEAKPASKPIDWVKAVGEWAERIRKRVEERKKREAEGKKEPEVVRKEPQKGLWTDYDRRITYPFEKVPRVVVRKLSAEALEIQFEDQTGALKPPPITNGKVEIRNLSDRPEHYPEPIELSITGEIEGAPFRIAGRIDLRTIAETGQKKNDLFLQVQATGVPLGKVIQLFAGESLSATFDKGTADLDAEINLFDFEKLAVRAPGADRALFALRDVSMTAKPGAKIAGFKAEEFCKAVNEVGNLEFKDLEIGGTILSPEFRWGETVKELVVSGGKAFAKKQAEKAIQKGTEKLQEALDKQMKGKAPDLQKKIGEILPGGDAKKSLQDGVSGAIDGLFGGKKKAPEKATEKAPEKGPEKGTEKPADKPAEKSAETKN